jgi:signal transduction histidine kinase
VPIVNPALLGESVQGVIAAWSYQPNVFNDHDLWLLSAIGTQAAIAIRNAKMFEASQRRAMEMAVINDVAHTLSSTLHLDQVLTRIMEQVEGMLDAEAGSLLLTDTSSGDLVFQIALGDKANEIKPFRVPRGQGIAGQVAESGKPLMIADATRDKRHFKDFDQQTSFLTRNILCVPLILHERVIGVLEVMNKRLGNFNQHDLKLLSSIASYAAIAIDNARLHESVLAERDKVLEAEEQARKKLARDLHDGPTQWVSAILMSLDFCKQALKKDIQNASVYLDKEFESIEGLAKRSVHQLRTALFELRPLALETQGLEAALEVFLERRQKEIEGVTKLRLEKPPAGFPRQDDKVETTIFAIVQETVNNAIKHAQAKNIVVTLQETADQVCTIIMDDGLGFEVDQVLNNYEQRGSLGMVNLRERTETVGGELIMDSAPGRGTTITIGVPKEKSERKRRRTMTGTLTLPPGMLEK